MKVDIFNTNKKYDIIYADPPWNYKVWSEKGKGRSAENHYPTMKKKDIQELPVKNISNKNSVLFLWVTAPCLLEGIELIKAWGFTYKTVAFTWMKKYKNCGKLFMGNGYYTRANAEYCLLATKGKVLERKSKSVLSAILTPIEEHSKKPSIARKRICELFGGGVSKIELFARQHIQGWDCWGNEAPEECTKELEQMSIF